MGTSSNKYKKQKAIFLEPLSRYDLEVIDKQIKKSVCEISCNSEKKGSGFLCKIPIPNSYNLLPVLITNNNILDENDILPGKKINILYDNKKISIFIDEERKTYTNKDKYNITIIEIKEYDGFNLDLEEFLDIDNYNNKKIELFKNKNIYIIHYHSNKDVNFFFGCVS